MKIRLGSRGSHRAVAGHHDQEIIRNRPARRAETLGFLARGVQEAQAYDARREGNGARAAAHLSRRRRSSSESSEEEESSGLPPDSSFCIAFDWYQAVGMALAR